MSVLQVIARWFGRRPAPPVEVEAPRAAAVKRLPPKPDEPLQYDEIAAFDPELRQLMTGAERTQSHDLVPIVRGRCLRMISELPPFPIMTSRILTAMENPDS